MPCQGGEKMTPAWAQRREALLRDCIVSPDVFHQMVDRLGDFAVPYQHALETEAGQSPVHLYLGGLLSHLGRKGFQSCGSGSESSWYGPSPGARWGTGGLCCTPQPAYRQ